MSLIQKLPWRSLPIESQNLFTANFNNPAGQYGFSAVAGNQGQLVIPLDKHFLYFIERVSFSSSIAEGTYLEASSVVADLPEIRLRYGITGEGAYPKPLPAINYKDNMEFNFYFGTKKENDTLTVDMTGTLNQPPALIGIATVYAQLSLVIYEIQNQEQVRRMLQAMYETAGTSFMSGVQ